VFTACFQSYHQVAFQHKVQLEEKEESEKLFFSTEDFKSLSWKEKGKEFEWKGEMYDVNSMEQTNDGYVVYCEKDGLEEILISFLKSIKKEMEGGATNFNIQPQFFQALHQFTFDPDNLTTEELTSEIPNSYTSICLSVVAPPPDSLNI